MTKKKVTANKSAKNNNDVVERGGEGVSDQPISSDPYFNIAKQHFLESQSTPFHDTNQYCSRSRLSYPVKFV